MTALPAIVDSKIGLRLLPGRGGAMRTELVSSRPAGFARVFAGLEVAELERRLPMIFSVCRQSQAAALAAARAAAEGREMAADRARQFPVTVAGEALFEATRALSLTLPGSLSIRPDPAIAAAHGAWTRLAARAAGTANGNGPGVEQAMRDLAEACRKALLGPAAELARDEIELRRWAGRRETAAARFLAELFERRWTDAGVSTTGFAEDADAHALAARLAAADGEAFAATPGLDGAPAETGALARMRADGLVQSVVDRHGCGLLARLVARLCEAGRLIDGLLRGTPAVSPGTETVASVSPAPGWGAGIVQSARGLLIHALRLDGGTVADFRIMAPTEWNFRRDGPAQLSLAAAAGRILAEPADRQGLLAFLVAAAYDPCLPLSVTVEHAEAGHA